MLIVQLSHKAFELLRPCVRAIGLAILVREQIQRFLRQRADQLDSLLTQRQGTVAFPLWRIGNDRPVPHDHRALHAECLFVQINIRPHKANQFTTAQAGFQQEHDLGHTICGIGFDRFHLLIAENVLDMLLSGAAVGAVLGRVLIAEVVLNRTFKDCIED